MCSCECKYVCARVGMWVYGTIVKVCACTSVYVCIRMSMNVYECVSVCTCSSINVQCGRESTIIGRLSSGHQWKQARMFLSSGYAAAAVKHRTPAPAASRVPAALLAVFAPAPDPAVGAHAFAAAVAAEAPLAVMLADAGAPAVLARVPHAVMLAPLQSLQVLLSRHGAGDGAVEQRGAAGGGRRGRGHGVLRLWHGLMTV
jgi:hypothetical protein